MKQDKNVMIKQTIQMSFWIIICVLQLFLSMFQDRPLIYVFIFSLLLGCMIIFAFNTVIDMIKKDDVHFEAKVIGSKYDCLILEVKNKKRTKEIRLGSEEVKKYQRDQIVSYIESRRTETFKGIQP